MTSSLSVVFRYIGSYYKTAFNAWYLITTVILLGMIVYFNYQPHSYFRCFITGRGPVTHLAASYLLYFIPFLTAFLLQFFFYKSTGFLKNKWLWILIALAPAFFALRVNFNLHRGWVNLLWSGDEAIFWFKCLSWVIKSLFIIALVYLTWFIKDRKSVPFYGSQPANSSFRPYLLLLLCMVPLIALAATKADFLNMYPRAQNLDALTLTNRTIKYFLYEVCYGFDFVSIEIFFRGFLIIAFMRICGMQAIVPAACFYCCIHLDKPLAEAISSFWGGLLLGIIAYHTKSIRGGLMIHLGIAWLMELAGFFGRSYMHG